MKKENLKSNTPPYLLIITVGVYSFLFYDLKYGGSTGKSFAKLSQTELNSLVKQIEFYKLQNGVYPDSLEQLRVKDATVIIQDPLLTRKMEYRLNTNFQYEKVDSGYTLFSVGMDGIPHTADDIYPNGLDSNSGRFGLIRK